MGIQHNFIPASLCLQGGGAKLVTDGIVEASDNIWNFGYDNYSIDTTCTIDQSFEIKSEVIEEHPGETDDYKYYVDFTEAEVSSDVYYSVGVQEEHTESQSGDLIIELADVYIKIGTSAPGNSQHMFNVVKRSGIFTLFLNLSIKNVIGIKAVKWHIRFEDLPEVTSTNWNYTYSKIYTY